MTAPFRILIADRNRHVREFLRQEFREAGYRVKVAGDGKEVLMMIDANEPPDLLILDPELPHGAGPEILQRLQLRSPPLPVVVHAWLPEHFSQVSPDWEVAIVEKRGDTNSLKLAVSMILRQFYPSRVRVLHGRSSPDET